MYVLGRRASEVPLHSQKEPRKCQIRTLSGTEPGHILFLTLHSANKPTVVTPTVRLEQ